MGTRERRDWSEAYLERIPVLRAVAEEIRALLHEVLADVPHIDRVSLRVKTADRFAEKASRINTASGELRYGYPLHEIQDQIGARIVVVYTSDVEPVAARILAEFREVEDRTVEQPEPERFGYEGRHFVCLIPPDIYDRHRPPIDFFELQASTVFQHAWAEANHDVGYKPASQLTDEERRRIAWAAAQAWGADLIFDDLWIGTKGDA